MSKRKIGFPQPQMNLTMSFHYSKIIIPDRLVAYRAGATVVAMIDSGIDVTQISSLGITGKSSKISFKTMNNVNENQNAIQKCMKIGVVVGTQMYRNEIDPTLPETKDTSVDPMDRIAIDRVNSLCNNDYSFLFHEVAKSLTIAHWMSGERLNLIYNAYSNKQ